MENKENKSTNTNEYYTIDLLHIAKTLWRKAWLIVLCGLLCGAIAFSYAFFGIAPKYSSSIMLYVNNSSLSLGNTSFNISASDLSAAQSLVKTYIVMLENRTTLEEVIEKSDVDYDYKELKKKISLNYLQSLKELKKDLTEISKEQD